MLATTIGILGGGLTGLTLGSLLPESEVLERDEVVGGLCRSRTTNGFTYDIGGSHVLFSRNKNIMRYVKEVLGDNIERRVRNTKIFFKGKYLKYPFENGLSDLSPEDNFECLTGYIKSYYARQMNESASPQNFEEWMYYHFGKGITERYLLPYNEKIWKIKAKKMSLKWIEGRIPDPPIEDVIKSSLGVRTEGYVHQLNFLYPRKGGIQALTDRIAEKCNSIRTNCEVKRISKQGNEFLVQDSESEMSYSKLVSTIPLPSLIKCLDNVPEEVERAAGELKYNSLISILLGMSVPKTKDYSWVYFPGDAGLFHRVSFPSNYSPEVAPEGNCSVLAEITCHEGDRIWNMSDAELIEDTMKGLDELEVINKGDVIFSDLTRMTPAYVIYDLEYDRNIKIVKDFIRQQGMEISGRFGEFEYLNMDACIERATSLADEFK